MVKVGDEIQVRVVEVDQQGRINLSAINLDQPFDPGMAKRVDDRGPRDRNDRGGERGGRPGGGGGRPGGGFGGDQNRGPRPEATAAAMPAPAEEEDDETPKVRFRPRR